MSGLRVDLGPAKEPLGMVRVLQWFFSIFSFATCGGYSGDVSFLVTCNNSSATVRAPFGYPFRLNQAAFSPSLPALCGAAWPGGDVHLVGDFSSSSQFFVTIAVLSFLYSTAALVLYVAFLHLYRGAGSALPVADLVVTAVLAFLWLCSSSAWGKALSDVRSSVWAPLPHCNPPNVTCEPGGVTSMRSLNASVILGFLNLILWAGGSWFVYKETPFHRPPSAPSAGPTTTPGAI